MTNLAKNSTYSIDFKGLSFGEHSFVFAIDDTLFDGYEDCEVLSGSGEVNIVLRRSETMLQLDITIEGDVEVECDRCLEACAIEVDYQAGLVVKFSDAEELADEYDGDVMWIGTSESTLDLTHYIYESIILSLPYQRVHADGECNPEMMAHFKIISAQESAQMGLESDDEQAEDSDVLPAEEMAKLQALKELMANEANVEE
ncbi:MAG: DUF177 domain-containing protein [Rikenellaceae bacterium]